VSEETKRKISITLKGHTVSDETRHKISKANKGKLLGHKHTNETKRKISEANKGRIVSKETRLKMSRERKGRIFSEGHKQKLSKAGIGRIVSEETKRKISKSLKGHVGWMKGKQHSIETRKKMSEKHKGYICSDKTRRKLSEAHKGKIKSNEERKKISERMIGNTYSLGHKHTEEAKKKISIANSNPSEEIRRKRSKAHKGKKLTEEHKRKISNAAIKRICSSTFNRYVSDTVPERQLKEIFKKNKIKFIHQYYVKDIEHRYAADFYLPDYKCVVEADGKYWHNYPDGNDIDHIRTKEMIEKGYKVLRFWEGQIEEQCVIDKISIELRRISKVVI
jgi:very-short-patch-repair endonuclease